MVGVLGWGFSQEAPVSVGVEEIAQAAGVSAATVSRALRGLPHVSAATREKVLQAAAQLNYSKPGLRAGRSAARTGSVGVIAPFLSRWYFAQVISGAEQALREAGFDLLVYNLGGMDGRGRLFQHELVGKRVDALMVISLPPTDAELQSLLGLGVPVALVGDFAPGLSGVSIDDVAGARLATQHLLNLGHSRLGLISGLVEADAVFSSQRDRRKGYYAALADAGIPANPSNEAHGDFSIRSGERAMDELLAQPVPPTAVFVVSDEMAFGAMRSVRRHGLRVPEDVSVVGFDGHEMADLLDLTTVEQPVVLLGEMAAWSLLQRMKSPSADIAAVTLPTSLVVRGSTRRCEHRTGKRPA